MRRALLLFFLTALLGAHGYAQSASQQPTGTLRVSTSDGLVSFEGVRELVFPANQVRITGRKATVFSTYGLSSGDVPALDASKITTGVFNTARLGSGTASSSTFLRGDGAWSAIPSSSVSSVFGRTGAVTAATNDYTWAQIDKTTSSLADLTTRSASDLSSGTLAAARLPAFSGDISTSAGSSVTTLAAAQTANVTRGSAQSIPDSTITAVTFDTETADAQNWHSTVTNTSRVTVTTAGPVRAVGAVCFAANSTGVRVAGIRLNGTTYLAYQQLGPVTIGGVDTCFTVSTPTTTLAASDYLELIVYQSSGGALNINQASYSPVLSVDRVR